MTTQEKRRYFRIHFKRQVQLVFSSEVYDNCIIQNISLGGMLVMGNFPHKVKDQCYVTISQQSKTASLTFKAQAKIIRKDDESIALEFVSMSFEGMVSLELILLFEPGEESSGIERTLPTDLPFTICEDEPTPFDF